MNKKHLIAYALFLIFTLSSQIASALQMNPLSVVLKPSGGGAKQSFRVTNESNGSGSFL